MKIKWNIVAFFILSASLLVIYQNCGQLGLSENESNVSFSPSDVADTNGNLPDDGGDTNNNDNPDNSNGNNDGNNTGNDNDGNDSGNNSGGGNDNDGGNDNGNVDTEYLNYAVIDCPQGFMEGRYNGLQDLLDTYEEIQDYQQCIYVDGIEVTPERLRVSPAPPCIQCESVEFTATR
tara:strand:- start:16622 stop:17152 length:531 start_codon:yes stop_codon:yes gene_type:complete